ncbi:isopentenyl phosphate kinase [Metallosphaera hakonensis]|uniref:isopentenyl phosphate kinase n=1 Tax=Metallosphaera hakonensis TaxID=79601 RepID=UPI001F1157C7|nr:isopentenyl phosphate kinase [Metallosphaera hakonensis]
MGGSVITCKAVPYCVDLVAVKHCAGELASFTNGLVVIHGGGSFGHFEARREHASRLTLTSASMEELNAHVLREMAIAGIRAFPLPGRFYTHERVESILGKGLVPVIYGDISEDGTIISGDDITLDIAKKYSLTAFFATDVDGVIIGDEVIPELSDIENFRRSRKFATNSFDLTGGMEEKIKKIFQNNVNAVIFNGKKKGNIFNVLKGERIGTFVKVRK